MIQKITIFFIILIAFTFDGCVTTPMKTLSDDLPELERINSVILLNGNRIDFNEQGGFYHKDKKKIIGYDLTNKKVSLETKDILYAYVQKIDGVKLIIVSTVTVSTASFIALLVILASKQSCPFIYSYDGTNYVFDAEPLGGAICKTLQRTDRTKLEHLKIIENTYKLKVSNEVNEIQYIDKFNLEYIDHLAGTDIIPDKENHYYAVSDIVKPISAINEKDENLLNFFKDNDDTFWQTKLPEDEYLDLDNLWNTIRLKYVKPKNSNKFKLVFKGGTSLWGSQMLRNYAELYGNKVENWYNSLYSTSAYNDFMQYAKHDNIYFLPVLVKDGVGWRECAVLPFGGPFIHETQLLDIDLSNHKEDTLELIIKPPKSFWAIDFIGLTNAYSVVSSTPLAAKTAIDDKSKNISFLEKISKSDSSYLVLPEVGDGIDLTFTAPELKNGYSRTVFAVTDGYYEMKLDTTKLAQEEQLKKISKEPGEIIRFALKYFKEKFKE
ncbi:MAG TPA: hypothetical protein PK762_01505 [Candidatus Kapabacteria bacterium]|nr:hypothetical protein [Candidatus Kapabacteria bacterium]